MADPVRFTDTVTVRLQPGAAAFVQAKAREIGTKPAEITRKALLAGLRSLGFDPAAVPARDAGALYDRSQDGRQRYAKVDGDQITAVSYHDDNPGEGWLPVVHVDSEPFDITTQWRLAPVYTIEPGRVVCTYPVVAKSLEAI